MRLTMESVRNMGLAVGLVATLGATACDARGSSESAGTPPATASASPAPTGTFMPGFKTLDSVHVEGSYGPQGEKAVNTGGPVDVVSAKTGKAIYTLAAGATFDILGCDGPLPAGFQITTAQDKAGISEAMLGGSALHAQRDGAYDNIPGC